MSTATLVSIDQYLSTTYRPDCDYVDGQLLERNLGQFDHGNPQGALYAWFHARRHEWNLRASVEPRVGVSPTRVRIPDVCVISRDHPVEQIVTIPPIICIEVPSPDDTLRSLQPRLDDYAKFGVSHIWILDPASQCAYIRAADAMVE